MEKKERNEMTKDLKDTKKCPKGRQQKYSKKRSGKPRNDDEVKEFKGNNDFNWYNLNKALVEMAARVPFGRPIGNNISFSVLDYNAGTITKVDKSIAAPGLASFYMHGSIGCSTDGAQTIDVAAKSIYSWVRHANSGHANYDSPDLMIYLLSCKEVYAAAGYMLKILGSVNKYDPANRYLPDAVLESLGVSAWIRQDIANFRYYCAQWFKKAAVLYTPKKFPLFEKAFWMFTQLFAEDKTGKGQLYHYVPSGFFKYNATKYNNGGCLEFDPITSFSTFNQFTTYFSDMLDRLIDDEDMGIMSGDIKKAFDNDVWTLGEFPFEGDLQIVYDSFVLQQIHNITPFLVTDTLYKDDIVQGTNNELLYFPRLSRTAINDGSRHFVVYDRDEVFIDVDAEVPTTEEVIEATQYSNRIKTGTPGARITSYYNTINVAIQSDDIFLITTSDYFCERFTVSQMLNGSNITVTYTMGYYSEVTALTAPFIYALLAGCSAFEWLPKVIMDNAITTLPFWQIHNYTLVKPDVVTNLHDATWLSLLAIPANEHLR